jgi:hypothetical protein
VADKVEPVSACSNVRAGGKQVVRELDRCTMNRGNCSYALYFTQPAPESSILAGGSPDPRANSPVEPTAAEKEGFLRKWLKQTENDLGLAAEHPAEAAKGAIKGQVNMVPELGEMMARGSALQHAAEMEERAALMRMFGSSRAADQMQASGEALRRSADQITFPKLDMSHPAAPAGDRLATIAQFVTGIAGLLKSGAKAGVRALAKSGGRAVAGKADDAARLGSMAAGEVKAADAAGDAARTEQAITREGGQLGGAGGAERAATAGGGVKIIRMRKGYRYELDELGRVKKVEGDLKRNPAQVRNQKAQLEAGGKDRMPTDEGGHYVGRRFDGPTDDFNHFAQDQNFNRGAYKQLENEWAGYLNNGKSVRIEITPNYPTGSLRPDTLSVKYWVDGQRMPTKFFMNAPGGT